MCYRTRLGTFSVCKSLVNRQAHATHGQNNFWRIAVKWNLNTAQRPRIKMTSSTSIPRPSIRDITVNLCTSLRDNLSNCVKRLSKSGESIHFGKKKEEGAELQDFGTIGRAESFGASVDDFEGGGGGEKITEWQAGWNVTNAIQGMFIVALPFSVLHGGYWAILAMIGVAYICCYTGNILVECLYEPDANGVPQRVRDSYVAIAKECFGANVGPKVVYTAQCIELLMTCILYIVLCGDLMVGTFPTSPIDARSWMMLGGITLLPCAFLKNLHHVSTLSFWCTVAHFLINLLVVAYCLSCLGHWGFRKVALNVDMETFPISLGIIVFSYTSHIFLPTLEGNMQRPERFRDMLYWSHVAAAAFKAGFGYIAFLTWQHSTMSVITNNLPIFWKAIVNFMLVVKAILSYPLPYFAAVELLSRVIRKNTDLVFHDKDKELTNAGCIFRVSIILLTVLMAVSIPHFNILMGFIGNFTGTMLSFIWPCYFHLRLKGNTLNWEVVAFDCFIIFLGVLFGLVGIYDSGKAMIEAFAVGLPF